MELPADFKVSEGILELERRVGVAPNFFRTLSDADDWSFVIKLHALFESACTHLLLFHFKEPELADVISRMELSNKATGKLAFLGKLELMGSNNRRYISTLSELRNRLVHDVRNSEFSLPAMVKGLQPAELKSMAIAFSPYETFMREHPFDEKLQLGYKEDMQKQSSIPAVTNRFSLDPKYHMWIGAYNVLASIIDMYDYSSYKQWTRAEEHLREREDGDDDDPTE